jgi:6,7-dimethyl-8-ribityllumazine synthase
VANVTEEIHLGTGLKIGIVVSRFNEWVTKPMLEGALNELRRSGVSDADIEVVWVPGAYEIPLACQTLCEVKSLSALVAIGCIIRGETSHYEQIAQSVCDGIQRVALKLKIPIGLGVLTVDDMAQAIDRAGGKHGNKGRDAARSALEMANLIRQLRQEEKKGGLLKDLMEQEIGSHWPKDLQP